MHERGQNAPLHPITVAKPRGPAAQCNTSLDLRFHGGAAPGHYPYETLRQQRDLSWQAGLPEIPDNVRYSLG